MEVTTGMVYHKMLILRDRKLLRKPNLFEEEAGQRMALAADKKGQARSTSLKACFVALKLPAARRVDEEFD